MTTAPPRPDAHTSPRGEQAVEPPPLDGVRVLDLTQGVAGPYATKLFSDYGAEVLKIERPGIGDPSRRMGPFPDDVPHRERSGMFLSLNTGKHSLTLDLQTASGRGILGLLAAEADIVVESFRPGTLARLGLAPEQFEVLNPRGCLVQISNFGQTGPRRDLESSDMLAYASGGVLQITGDPELGPLRIGTYAPLFLVGGVVAAFAFGAFLAAHRDGIGERVDVSIQEVLASSMDRGGVNLVSYQYSGMLRNERVRELRGNAMPRGVYPCKNGYVFIAGAVQWWDRLWAMIGRPDLAADEQLQAGIFDVATGVEVDAYLYPWLLERTKREVTEQAQAVNMPVGALNSMGDVFADGHLRARGFFTVLDHPEGGEYELPGMPFRMLGTPSVMRRAPLLGEHTFEVLTERLGYAPHEVAMLRQRDIV